MPRGIPKNPRAARVEGSAAPFIDANDAAAAAALQLVGMAGSSPTYSGGANRYGGALTDILASFKADHADLWEQIRLGPTQHGIDQMIEALDK